MIIESIQTIPLSKESKFEDVPNTFEVAFITTSYEDWRTKVIEYSSLVEIDLFCYQFAEKQKAFMLAPTAVFGTVAYAAKTVKVDSLDNISIDGPLYMVNTIEVDDVDAEKNIFRKYVDPESFALKEGLWHPTKKAYRIRYGVPI